MNKKFSIIIPTYKRKDSLLRLLESLLIENKSLYEVIVVEQVINNGRAFKLFAKKNNIDLTYIFLEQASTPHAKNVGAKSAKGKYFIFFDDDVTVEKGILQAYQKAFEKDKRDALGGRVITPGQEIHPDSNNVGRISYWGKFSDDFSSEIRQEIDTLIGCNAAWKRSVFEEVGGFDEQITMNGIREESDLCLRAKSLGYKIYFEPLAVTQHLREETGGGRKSEGRLSWYYNYLSNETYFFLKYRPTWVVLIILLTRWEWILRCMFGFGREVSFRSISTPFSGIGYGFRKYRRWKNAHRS